MTEYFLKQDRYKTLLGDTIEKGFLRKAFKAPETVPLTLTTALTTLTLSAAHNAEAGALACGILTVATLPLEILSRASIERLIILRSYDGKMDIPYVTDQTFKNLTIDTAPDEKASINSVKKYGLKFKKSALGYKLFAACSAAMAPLAAITTSTPNLNELPLVFSFVLSASTVPLARALSGINRFNKLAKGEWAIVDEPEGGQKSLEKHLFTLNNRAPKLVNSHAFTPAALPAPAND